MRDLALIGPACGRPLHPSVAPRTRPAEASMPGASFTPGVGAGGEFAAARNAPRLSPDERCQDLQNQFRAG